jgi:hypothetical protein
MNKYSKLLRSDFLILKRDYLKIVKDLNTAVYLSYLIDKYDYFSSNNMITIFDNKEYFFNIQKDIEETIYLSPKQQRSCLDVLIKLKIVKTKLKGIPAKTFFNIDFDLLVELLMNIENTSNKEMLQQDVTKGNNNNLQKGTYITNTKELITNTNIKEIKNSCEIEISQEQELNIISKQNDFITQYPEVIDLLDVSMIEVFNENKYTIDEFCKSKDFELIKKEYRMVKRNLPAPKPKNRETLTNWYLSLGKVQVADNLYMYPYQAIILKLVFNHKYLAKMINHYDSTWFSRENKFKEFTDHYANIVSWLKSDIEKNILKQGNNQFDRYYYYNWGVDRNEIL